MAHADGHTDHSHLIIPFKTLLSVFLALVALTLLTVAAAQMELGALNVPVALGIAAAKAGLVVTFFMALKYDKPVNTMVLAVGTVFVLVFLSFTLFDTVFRGDIGNVDEQTIAEEEAALERLRQQETDPEALEITPSGSGAQDADAAAGGSD